MGIFRVDFGFEKKTMKRHVREPNELFVLHMVSFAAQKPVIPWRFSAGLDKMLLQTATASSCSNLMFTAIMSIYFRVLSTRRTKVSYGGKSGRQRH